MAAMDFHTYDNALYEKVYQTAYQAAAELIETAGMKAGQILVVGCSTSEVGGEKIGTYSSPELAAKVFGGIYAAVQEKGIYLAAQCCEHLNRALILETEAAEKYGYEPVNVMPQPKAGAFADPVAVEHIAAHAGMDIGDTLIGMHLKDVAVPVRLSIRQIGEAHLVCARTRRKFVGGVRAVYDERYL